MKNWIKLLGFKSFLIISIGKLFHIILRSIRYDDIHMPLKNEVLFFRDQGFQTKISNNLICVYQKKGSQKYLLRPGTSDKKVFNQVIIENEYLPLVNLIKSLNAEGSIKSIIDAGSNIGLTSFFLKLYYPTAKIISIEPDPFNKLQQEKNIHINHFADTITLMQKALWHNSIDKLSISNDFRDGESWSKSVQLINDNYSNISSITLSDAIKQYFAGCVVDILKIDIEGSESILFKNDDFVSTISTKVKFLSLEIHDECNSRPYITKILEDNNFQILNVGETTFCFNKYLLNRWTFRS